MKKHLFAIFAAVVLAAEITVLVVFAVRSPAAPQNAVTVNEAVQSVTRDFYNLEKHENATSLDYVVIDNEGNPLYRTRAGLSESINSAISHRDTILDITRDGETVGKIIIRNDEAVSLKSRKQAAIAVLAAAIIVQCGICVGYAAYVYRTVVKPFGRLKGFAERIAGGNLDVPLEMDRRNIFGAFTESFDIMRSELKRARIAEAKAQQSKKELVAKLSHDIKTPVASIKALAEVGLAVTAGEKDRRNYTDIIAKSDQINTLVTNLFTATLEELEQLSVTPTNLESSQIKVLLENADYLHRASVPPLPECLLYADRLRLQQVFDNVFANSYKYANTDVAVSVCKGDDCLNITVEDFGGGVPKDEIAVLKEKFRRGSNAANIEGAGLGLYISDYFMKEMGGALKAENGAHGLKITVSVALSGTI